MKAKPIFVLALCVAAGAFAASPVVVEPGLDIDPQVRLAARELDRPLVPAGIMPLRSPVAGLPAVDGQRASAIPSVALKVPMAAAASGVGTDALSNFPQDLQNIVRACEGDAFKLFDFVHNEIRHQPYRGFRKRPELTWQTRSGSSADQAWLLVELLHAAGYSAMFEFGSVYMPIPDACAWLGVDNVDALLDAAGGAGWRCGQIWDDYFAVEEIWAVVQIDGGWYRWVPGFKRLEEVSGADLTALSGMDGAALFGAAGGTESSIAVSGVSEPGVAGYLSDRAAQLRAAVRANHPNAGLDELCGEFRVVETKIEENYGGWPDCWAIFSGEDTAFFDSPYEPVLFTRTDGSTATYDFTDTVTVWFGLPSADGSEVEQSLVSLRAPLAYLAGRELTVGPGPGYRAQIRLDGEVLYEASVSYLGPLGIEYFIDHKTVRSDQWDYSRYQDATYDGRYALVLGLGGYQNGALFDRQSRRIEELARAGYAVDSAERVDASLTKLGLDYLRQSYVAAELAARLTRSCYVEAHTVVLASHEYGIGVDIPTMGRHLYRNGAPDPANSLQRAQVIIGSAMEHAVIEQNYPGVGAVSTVRFMRENNLVAGKTYFLTSADYEQVKVDPDFIAGWSSYYRNTYFPGILADGGVLAVPQRGRIDMNEVYGNGYFEATDNYTAAYISHGYSLGGFSDSDVLPDGTLRPQPGTDNTGPENKPNDQSEDPVDLYNGNCVADQTDLSLGASGARGLSLSRHYSSAGDAGPSQFGRGWSHNFEGFLTEHTDTVAAFGGGTVDSAASAIVALQAIVDLSRNSLDTPKGWVVASIAAFWALEQAKDNTVTATFNRRNYSFTRQADGSYTPSAGLTATLVKDASTGLFRIEERFGNTLFFDAERRLASFTDADGKSLALTYADSGADVGKLQTVTDCYGRTLTFAYHSDAARAGLLASVTDSTGRTVEYDYTDGQLTSVTDPEGHARTFAYGADGRLWKTFDELGREVTETLYDAHGAVHTQIAEADANQTWQYAFTGVLNTETNPLGEVSAYRYDRFGRLVAETDGEGHTATREYDGQNHLVAVANALGQRTTFQYDARHNLRFITDARSAVTEHRYDEQDRLRYTVDPLGKTTEFRYDGEHHLVKTIDPLLRETTIEYHTSGAEDGLPWKTIAPNGDTTTTSYDVNGHPDSITRADGSVVDVTYSARGDLLGSRTTTAGDPNDHAVSFTYDGNRRVLTSTDALGFGVTNTFDPAGNLEASDDRAGNVVSFTYSPWGRKLTATAPSGEITYFGYDPAGRSTTVTDALGQITRFGYDRAGRPTTTTDPLQRIVTRTFDAAGRNDSLTNARGKTWLFGFTATGQPETLTTPLSRLTDTDYNLRGQPETVTEPSLQATAFAYYDDARVHTATDAVGTITYGYDANGRLETVTEAGQTITRHYNTLGQLDRFTDGAGNQIAYKYDGAGNLTELTYPGSPERKVNYTYDSADRLETVTDWAGRVTHFRYDDHSRLWRIELPNGTQRVFMYDSAGRVADVRDEVAASGLMVSEFSLGYDALDRIVEETMLPEPAPFAVTAAAMTYDDDDRLTAWNALTTESDLDGNLAKGPLNEALTTFAYDVRNRLTSVGTSSYTYDVENRRITRAANGVTTTFVHDPNAALSRLLQSTTGSATTRYVYAGSLLLYAETGSALRVHHYDYRGSTVALTDATGTVLGRVTYGSYGEIVARTGDTATEFLYNGRDGVVTDPNGLYHMRARYYSPETRRFLNADPIGFGGGNNWYVYVGGSPVMSVDPRGLCASNSNGNEVLRKGISLHQIGYLGDGFDKVAEHLLKDVVESYGIADSTSVILVQGHNLVEGYYKAYMRGNNSSRFEADDIVGLLKNNGWTSGTVVFLAGCNTGASPKNMGNPMAQQVAGLLGSGEKVYGVDGKHQPTYEIQPSFVYVTVDGKKTISGTKAVLVKYSGYQINDSGISDYVSSNKYVLFTGK